ncbi:cobalt-precorrin-6A reductase [Chelatococcus asaccharovorans]|uniref:cobalt-precorrin-6A reductase n=1 Tax=Chelatococcus asaccharovorans TaxID=28210 RepID=UPI000D75A6E9|nr:cobalt-precorrin-6A reductase [Chelatococcus asaccharovorans]MBS7704462.1 cobalt-precorrin-6A reductase [Chelatococcus asaccharovorans]
MASSSSITPRPAVALNILILGGTTEASRLAALVAGRPDIAPVLSLAGRTREPAPAPIPLRVGGFGGVDGLVRYLEAARIDAVIDATHPFAARISAHAAQACARQGIPLARLTRPAWSPEPGDRWQVVPAMAAAAAALGPAPRRVFLTIGRQELAAFNAAPQHHYVVRSIDAPDGFTAPQASFIAARGPFALADEEALMRAHAIDVLVTKNAGGAATAAKLVAARHLGLPVVMVARPAKPDVPTVDEPEEALAWAASHRPAP